MLAGYTAAMLGFPSVADPSTVFDTALARVEEISLGIICATVVHSVILPRGIAPMLLAQLDSAIKDARHWMRDTLTRSNAGRRDKDRRAMQTHITALEQSTAAASQAHTLFLHGKFDYLSVLDAQRTQAAAESALAATQAERSADQITLFLALGGWETPYATPAAL